MQIIHQTETETIFSEKIATNRLSAFNDLFHSFVTFRKVSLAFYSENDKLPKVKIVSEVIRKYDNRKDSLSMAIGFVDCNSSHHSQYGILELPEIAIEEMKMRGIVICCEREI